MACTGSTTASHSRWQGPFRSRSLQPTLQRASRASCRSPFSDMSQRCSPTDRESIAGTISPLRLAESALKLRINVRTQRHRRLKSGGIGIRKTGDAVPAPRQDCTVPIAFHHFPMKPAKPWIRQPIPPVVRATVNDVIVPPMGRITISLPSTVKVSCSIMSPPDCASLGDSVR
jgi:hypothetical protein